MKKSSEVQGLPIISIADGTEIGRVKSLIINPEKRSIDFITIKHEEWEMEGKAVPFNKIVGIGEYALTIDQNSSVIEMNEIPVASELLNRKTKIEQTRLMTKKGRLIGEATGYAIDEESGEIKQLFVTDFRHDFVVDGDFVVTYGKDLIVVSEDVEMKQENEEPAKPAFEAPPAVQTPEVKKAEPKQEPAVAVEPAQNAADWLRLIDEQQTKLLKGKKVTKDIKHGDELIISAGTVLDEEAIRKARAAGPELLIEISMNSEA